MDERPWAVPKDPQEGEAASPAMYAAFARLREIGRHGLRKQTADHARDTAIVASSPRRLVEMEWRGDDSRSSAQL